jgi:O-acetyl-ADP-ribose deacetylase (regulator of RNase III)
LPARIEAVRLDITLAAVDAVVNAANESLQLGGGVAGAIRRRGGPSIQEECDRIGHCPPGQAVVTGAGDLPAKNVIHAVGPVWGGGRSGEEKTLASAISAALARAEEIGARSVAIPAISAGIFGFPLERAAEISVAAARSFARTATVVERIVFCLIDDEAAEVFRRALEKGA